ncbi:MAG: 8-amino-7-oxononanoate synthase [Balneolaceae bacterium]|nr:8-amino-7-oxononanoate synthase [Balneolaceae bacterium]
MTDRDKRSFIQQELADRKAANKFRSLAVVRPQGQGTGILKGGKELINFSANDYLGLSKHPRLIQKAQEYTKSYGAGSTASRLISGTYDIHDQLEEKLADVFGREAALVFNSGFQANSTIVSTLTDRHSLVLADKLCHNSLLQGALLSRATLKRYDHNNIDDLKSLLQSGIEESYNRILIITETVFSMDGDRADIAAISKLANEFGALLFVDDAHAVGVWGEQGLGLAKEVEGIDILLGTCGKAFGSFGSYVVCSRQMRDYLVNFCPGFIYTTALPPAVIGAIDAAVDLIPKMDDERNKLHENISYMRDGIQEIGFKTGSSSTQIIPIIIGDEKECLDLAQWLEEQGILATAIRPPTVPEKSSRIRITLSASHSKEQINHFLDALKRWSHG